MSTGMKLLILSVLAVSLGSFLYLRSLTRRLSELPELPPAEARTELRQFILEVNSSEPETVDLYFPAPLGGRLRKEERTLPLAPTAPDRATQLLLALKEGSRSGLRSVIPWRIEIRAIFLTTDGTLYVDFGNTFPAGFSSGIEAETLAVFSIVNTLAVNIRPLRQVRILLEGKEVETLAGHIDLTRAYSPDPRWVE